LAFAVVSAVSKSNGKGLIDAVLAASQHFMRVTLQDSRSRVTDGYTKKEIQGEVRHCKPAVFTCCLFSRNGKMETLVGVVVGKLKLAAAWSTLPVIAIFAFYGAVHEDARTRISKLSDMQPALIVARKVQIAAALPPQPPQGIFNFEMDWPANGMTYNPLTTDTIRGYVSGANIPVLIEAQDPSGAWQLLGLTTSVSLPTTIGTASSTPAYAWSLPATIPSFWTVLKIKGGVLRLRATPSPNWSQFNAMGIPQTFDADSAACLVAAYPSQTWTQASNTCGSVFPLLVSTIASAGVGVTVLSTARVPADNYWVMTNQNPPAYISMVQPVSSTIISNTIPPPLIGQHYYQTIQPPTTLTNFRTKYGFNASGAGPYVNGEVESTYYNQGDLGIGRNMHCRRFGSKKKGLACYVKNYAKTFNGEVSGVFFGEDEEFVLDQTIAQATNNHFATVAMVQLDGSTSTDFIVYDENGNLQPFAKLDGLGHNAAVPTNCQSCHGGNYSGTTTAGGIATGARFLPFDSDDRVLKFSTTNSAYTKAAQATNIRDLNMMIYNSPQTILAVKKQITLMYGGNDNATAPGPAYTDGHVLSTWQNNAQSEKLYREVVHPYCIGCHLSYPNPTSTANNPFASYNDFVNASGSVLYDICIAHSMPNAQQTATLFWKSPARAYLLNHLGAPAGACDP
jgi:hypothetical protein